MVLFSSDNKIIFLPCFALKNAKVETLQMAQIEAKQKCNADEHHEHH